MSLIDAALGRTRTTLASLALILIAGTAAYIGIPKEDAPDIDVPVIFTRVAQSGISPEDAERLIARPVEQAMRGIDGVKQIRSEAYLGGATVTVEFDDGFNPDKALEDVREKVKVVEGELPADAGEPTVHEVNLSLFPVLVVTIGGDAPERELIRTARDLRETLEALPDVLEARLVGDRDEVVEIIVDPVKLSSYRIDPGQLIGWMARSNRLVAAGNLDTGAGRFAVKVPGVFTSTEDISDLPVAIDGDAMVRVRDIATVRRTFADRATDARLNGKRALAIEISKRLGTSIIDVTDEVRETVAKRARTWPEGIEIAYSQDKSTKIRDRVTALQNNVLNAVLLVMIVLIAALGPRSAALVGVAIPGSFLLGILAISLAGFTANTVVLFALILAVGLLVDGSIVMVEYAQRRLSAGESPREAYARASKHMAWPIIASTATTLAAFLPLVFWPGTVGEFMKYLPATVLAVLAASLLMALIFVPVLGAVLDRRRPGREDAEDPDSPAQLDKVTGLTRLYLGLLRVVLKYPVVVLFLAFCAMLWAPWMYSQHGREIEFFPKVEGTGAVVLIHARGNLSLAEQDALTREVEDVVLAIDGLESLYTSIGRSDRAGGSGPQDIIARLRLELKPWDQRRPAAEILEDIQKRTAHLAGIRVAVQEERTGPVQDKPYQIEVLSSGHDGIPQAVREITDFLAKQPYIRDIEDSLPVPGVEWRVEIDRTQALKFGVDVERVGQFVRLATKGLKLTEFRASDADEEIDVLLRFPERYRNLQQLDGLMIETAKGAVPLGSFARLEPKPQRGTIRRVDGFRSALIKADVVPGTQPEEFRGEVKGYAITARFADGTRARMKGEEEDLDEREKDRDFLRRCFFAALFLMAIILVTQFNSFYSAGLILSAVMLSIIGVVLGLLIMDLPYGTIMSGIGVIALAGIVVNNNIVLIDTYDRLKARGVEAQTALLLTGVQRLRPVLLTTATTIGGLVPMVSQTSIDFLDRSIQHGGPASQLWVQLATSITFGLAFATVLTLAVTPAALMLRARFDANREARRIWMRQAFRRLDARGPVETIVTVLAVCIAWVLVLEMILVRIFDIVTKQFSDPPSVWFQAIEWSAFWTFIILTVAFGYFRDAHVRVDIIRERLSARLQAAIEIFGFFVLLAPVCLIVMYFGLDYVARSYIDEEPSGALLGSPTGFIFKAMLPFGYLLLLLAGVSVTIRNIRHLTGRHRAVAPERDGRRLKAARRSDPA